MRTQKGRIAMVCGALCVVMGGCSERMGRGWDWNRMRMQPRYEPYRASKFFVDGKAMQLPPVGTVSRESGLTATPQQQSVPTGETLARGKEQFHIYCAVCHGERADGEGLVARNMDAPKPPSLIAPPVSLMPPDVIASVIANGIGPMPPFASDMTAADRRAVADYVVTLRQ